MLLTAKSAFVFFHLAIFLCLTPCLSAAQDLDNVSISGRVTDQNGALIPGRNPHRHPDVDKTRSPQSWPMTTGNTN